MKVKVKNRTYRYDTNKTRPRNGYEYTKYNICLSMMRVMQASNTQAISEALFKKKLSNTKAELKKVYKKACNFNNYALQSCKKSSTQIGSVRGLKKRD